LKRCGCTMRAANTRKSRANLLIHNAFYAVKMP
jgi:hypothetical protein